MASGTPSGAPGDAAGSPAGAAGTPAFAASDPATGPAAAADQAPAAPADPEAPAAPMAAPSSSVPEPGPSAADALQPTASQPVAMEAQPADVTMHQTAAAPLPEPPPQRESSPAALAKPSAPAATAAAPAAAPSPSVAEPGPSAAHDAPAGVLVAAPPLPGIASGGAAPAALDAMAADAMAPGDAIPAAAAATAAPPPPSEQEQAHAAPVPSLTEDAAPVHAARSGGSGGGGGVIAAPLDNTAAETASEGMWKFCDVSSHTGLFHVLLMSPGASAQMPWAACSVPDNDLPHSRSAAAAGGITAAGDG